jgi:hypothetical protein
MALALRKANLADLPHIISLLTYTYGEENMKGAEWYYSQRIRNEFDILYLLNEDNTALFMFERIGNFKCQLHVYSTKAVRGKRGVKCFEEALEYLRENTMYTIVLTFVPVDNKAADVMTRRVGFDLVGSIEHAGGLNKEEVLYSMSLFEEEGGN